MASHAALHSQAQLDLSDVEPRVGQLVGGGQLWEPCTAMDIRRWVMAMDALRSVLSLRRQSFWVVLRRTG